eukprot:TRINITY_DN7734_c0_g1_i2.p2 TRINITY_DN7734_c0_g1~~TRINITY_DN7734_c0_g1_i2.p2  ORF type:complete len:111 (-),score=5.28 TRINITY_DN7734_c0_g1_i2:101-433(-)
MLSVTPPLNAYMFFYVQFGLVITISQYISRNNRYKIKNAYNSDLTQSQISSQNEQLSGLQKKPIPTIIQNNFVEQNNKIQQQSCNIKLSFSLSTLVTPKNALCSVSTTCC